MFGHNGICAVLACIPPEGNDEKWPQIMEATPEGAEFRQCERYFFE
jgi:hypothetical protein